MHKVQYVCATGTQQEEQQACAKAAGRQLSATVRLILQLVQHGFGMSADDMAVLTKHMSPQVCNQTLKYCSHSLLHTLKHAEYLPDLVCSHALTHQKFLTMHLEHY